MLQLSMAYPCSAAALMKSVSKFMSKQAAQPQANAGPNGAGRASVLPTLQCRRSQSAAPVPQPPRDVIYVLVS